MGNRTPVPTLATSDNGYYTTDALVPSEGLEPPSCASKAQVTTIRRQGNDMCYMEPRSRFARDPVRYECTALLHKLERLAPQPGIEPGTFSLTASRYYH